MSGNTRKPPEATSLITPPEETAVEQTEMAKEGEVKDNEKKTTELYTPKQREKKPVKLTADQYLKQVSVKEGIAGLVRAMYGTKIMSFEEWGKTVNALLKRKVR
jgi:hypothetical protein